jgi:hypothetical protein
MPSTTAPLPLPTIPPEALAYAERQGAASYIPSLLEMTRRLFPDASLSVALYPDPEIANEFFLCIEVEAAVDATADWYLVAKRDWLEEKLRLCPTQVAIVFTCSLV